MKLFSTATRSLVCSVGLYFACSSCFAYDPASDRIWSALDRSRETYERAVETVRVHVRDALAAKRDRLKKSKEGSVAVDAVIAETKAFDSSGTLPDVGNRGQLEQEYAKAAAGLRKAFSDAKLESSKPGLDAVLNEVSLEAGVFESQWDLVPWQSLVTKDNRPEADRTLTADSKPFAVETGLTGEFRLELKARKTSDEGDLTIELPTADSKRLTLPVAAGDKGEIRLLMTVVRPKPISDLGTNRPLGPDALATETTKALVLRAKRGTLVIDSIRVKPVVEGRPPESKDVAKKAPQAERAPRGASGPANLLPPNSKWGGTFHNRVGGHDAEATVQSQSGSNVVIRVSVGDYGTRDWDFTVSGNNLVLNECRIVHTKFGNEIKNIKVSGSIQEGKLSVSGSWIYQGGGAGGESISLDLTRK